MNERIGELLVKENLLTKEQLRDARASAKGTGNRLGSEITKMGLLDENALADFVAKQYGVPSINLDEFEIDRRGHRARPRRGRAQAQRASR